MMVGVRAVLRGLFVVAGATLILSGCAINMPVPIKNLSVNNIIVDLDFSEGHDGGCQVVQCDEATIQLFVSHQ